jgi:hypothetical protein
MTPTATTRAFLIPCLLMPLTSAALTLVFNRPRSTRLVEQ